MGPLSRRLRKEHYSLEVSSNFIKTLSRLELPERRPEIIPVIKDTRVFFNMLHNMGIMDRGLGLKESKDYTEAHWPLYEKYANWEG